MRWSSYVGSRPPREVGPTWVLDLSGVSVLALGLFGCLLVAAGVLGCEGVGARAELFEIDSVGPDRIEAGRRVVLEGRDFPDHRLAVSGAEVRLLGTLHQPGDAVEIALSLPAEIVSSERAEALVTGGFLETVGDGSGRGTFRGRVELVVPMAEGAGLVGGHLDGVVLDLVPSRALGRVEDDTLLLEPDPVADPELSAAEGARSLLGIALEEAPEGAPIEGLAVANVDPERLGASFGLRAGDRLVAVDGLRLLSSSDLAAWGGARVSSIEIVRDEEAMTLVPASRGPSTGEDVERGGHLLAALLLVVLVLLRERDRPAPAISGRAFSFGRATVPSLAAGLLVFGALHTLIAATGVDRLPMLLAPSIALLVLAGSIEGGSPFSVLVAFARAGAVLSVLVSATLAAPLGDLREIEAIQSLAPWTWPLFSTPIAPALVVMLATAITFVRVPARESTLRMALPRVAQLVAECAVVLLLVVSVAGGRGEANLLGAVAFAVRGVILLALLRGVSWALINCPPRARVVVVASSAVVTLLFGVGSMRIPLADAWRQASAQVWLAALVLAALLLLRPRPADPLERELAL